MSTYRVRVIPSNSPQQLSKLERFVAEWLLVTPRYATIAEKLRAVKCSTADNAFVEKVVVCIYGKLGISSRYELLASAEDFNIPKPKEYL